MPTISQGVQKSTHCCSLNNGRKYQAFASDATDLTWISYILRDMSISQPWPSLPFFDNISTLYLTANPIFHARPKHIELDYHSIREEKVAFGSLITRFVPSSVQVVDIFTKLLPYDLFISFRNKLGLWSIPTSGLRGSIEPNFQDREREDQGN